MQFETYDETIGKTIEKASEGDEKSFETIVDTYRNMVYNICYRYFNNEEDAKDVAQDVFIRVYKNLHKYNYKCKFSTWLYRITVNLCIDHHRKNKHLHNENNSDSISIFSKNESVSENPEEALLQNDFIKEIEIAINKLNSEQRIIVILRIIENLSYQEISLITGISIGTVKSRLSRARQQLKAILKTENI